MHYTTAFEITHSAPFWPFPAVGFLFVIIGCLFNFAPSVTNMIFGKPAPGKTFRVLFLGFAVVWTIAASIAVFGDYYLCRNAYEQGKFRVVEGTVQDFHPQPASGHDTERFTVNGTKFEYGDYIVSSGFHTSQSHGGPIHEGLPVRISYRANRILKLEIGDK